MRFRKTGIQSLLTLILVFGCIFPSIPAIGQSQAESPSGLDHRIATAWADLTLELTRTTPGFSPPVAARAFGYFGVTLWEALAPALPGSNSLAGQLNDLPSLPPPDKDQTYAWPLVVNSALAGITRRMFAGGGMTARNAIDGLETSLRKRYAPGIDPDVVRRSQAQGRLVAAAVYAWSRTDGGHEGQMFNFPEEYTWPSGQSAWAPTPPAYSEPLQPYRGQNRPFVLASGAECAPPPPPPYDETPGSAQYLEAMEVYTTVKQLTPAQREIALYWADDPGLTATPPGHSLAIATEVLRAENATLAQAAETYARLGIAVADAFIACWNAKSTYNRIRPHCLYSTRDRPRLEYTCPYRPCPDAAISRVYVRPCNGSWRRSPRAGTDIRDRLSPLSITRKQDSALPHARSHRSWLRRKKPLSRVSTAASTIVLPTKVAWHRGSASATG